MKLFAWTTALAVFLTIGVAAADSSKPLVGVISAADDKLPAELKSNLGRDHIEVATSNYPQGNGEAAVEAALQLVREKHVNSIIMASTDRAALDKLIAAKLPVPVISLMPAPSKEFAQKASSAGITVFSQDSGQLDALAKALPQDRTYALVDPSAFPDQSRQLANGLSQRKLKNVGVWPETPQTEASDVVLTGVVDASQAKQILTQPSTPSGILFSPPSSQNLATVAAGLTKDWAKSGRLDKSGWSTTLSKSANLDKEGAVAVKWDVTAKSFALVSGSAIAGETTCRCKSKDGSITHETTCHPPHDKCTPDEQQSDCSCKCS